MVSTRTETPDRTQLKQLEFYPNEVVASDVAPSVSRHLSKNLGDYENPFVIYDVDGGFFFISYEFLPTDKDMAFFTKTAG